MKLWSLRTRAEHRAANAALARVFRDAAGATPLRIHLFEGKVRGYHDAGRDLWLATHALPNRYRNAFGPGDPRGRAGISPSVQLNLALAPGGARPHARFARDATGNLWIAHSGTLGGRQVGISRDQFVAFLATPLQRITLDDDTTTEDVLLLGTVARPRPLLDAIARLAHGAAAFRAAIALLG